MSVPAFMCVHNDMWTHVAACHFFISILICLCLIPKQLMVRYGAPWGGEFVGEFVSRGSSSRRESIDRAGDCPQWGGDLDRKPLAIYGPSLCLQLCHAKNPTRKIVGQQGGELDEEDSGRPDLPVARHGTVASGDGWESELRQIMLVEGTACSLVR